MRIHKGISPHVAGVSLFVTNHNTSPASPASNIWRKQPLKQCSPSSSVKRRLVSLRSIPRFSLTCSRRSSMLARSTRRTGISPGPALLSLRRKKLQPINSTISSFPTNASDSCTSSIRYTNPPTPQPPLIRHLRHSSLVPLEENFFANNAVHHLLKHNKRPSIQWCRPYVPCHYSKHILATIPSLLVAPSVPKSGATVAQFSWHSSCMVTYAWRPV